MAKKMISTNKKFHSSVNVAYDLYDEDKIRSFIPTVSACKLIESIFMATAPDANSRAKVLVGAYGRGKSHIILMALSLLSKKNPSLFQKFFSDIQNNSPKFAKYAKEYLSDGRRLLPVVITGNTPSLAQSFLQALQSALRVEGLEELMPDTNIQGALSAIEIWKTEYPETYTKFSNSISVNADEFVAALNSFDIDIYEEFLELYPALTSGGTFNSFMGLDVVSTFDKTVSHLRNHGYDGIYVVYDEFSKYLETNIQDATLSDVKLLQDFAEKCNRSANHQIHLLLICHKDIANYIDGKLPKERLDGWRGVSGRFEHIEIRNGFTQSYELIESSIIKDADKWADYVSRHESALSLLEDRSVANNLIDSTSSSTVIRGCYPLHPVTTFLLPRISERVAQNERTLFTYLVSNEKNSLIEAYSALNENALAFVTPDNLYDYFEPLFRKEPYTSEIHGLYELTARILLRVDHSHLEAKIIKTLMLIYAASQFECLAPTKEQIIGIFSSGDLSTHEVNASIESLITKDAVIYLRKSNGYLKLKESSGVDIEEEIKRFLERERGKFSVEDVLNGIASGKAMYPSRHNDENEIVRYFQCKYISGDNYWNIVENGLTRNDNADGHLLAILPYDKDDLKDIEKSIEELSGKYPEIVFILPKKYKDINEIVLKYYAAHCLGEDVREDALLADEYDVMLEDYSEVIASFNSEFFQPELKMAHFFQGGVKRTINRKAKLSALLSQICDDAYPKTPLINNEAINKNELSPAAVHSRTKILNGLCRPQLEANLGLQGNGQECSIMRSVFAVTGIIEDIKSSPRINFNPDGDNYGYLFSVIREFVYSGKEGSALNDLYESLTTSEKQIGLKRGLVILFLGLVLREDWNNLLLMKGEEEQRLTAGVLNEIDSAPDKFTIKPVEWTQERAKFVHGVLSAFSTHSQSNASAGDFTQAADAMYRWYLALPRFAKTATRIYGGSSISDNYEPINKAYVDFLRALKRSDVNPRGFLFDNLPDLFACKEVNTGLLSRVTEAKIFFDSYVAAITERLTDDLRSLFGPKAHPDSSLTSIIAEWCEGLNDGLRGYVLPGSANRTIVALQAFTNDEEISLKRLFKAVTGLRIEDWDERTIEVFISEINNVITSAEKFLYGDVNIEVEASQQIAFINTEGELEKRLFQTAAYSPRAKLLKNEIENAIDEMGQSIEESEKRQVLFDILRRMC